MEFRRHEVGGQALADGARIQSDARRQRDGAGRFVDDDAGHARCRTHDRCADRIAGDGTAGTHLREVAVVLESQVCLVRTPIALPGTDDVLFVVDAMTRITRLRRHRSGDVLALEPWIRFGWWIETSPGCSSRSTAHAR